MSKDNVAEFKDSLIEFKEYLKELMNNVSMFYRPESNEVFQNIVLIEDIIKNENDFSIFSDFVKIYSEEKIETPKLKIIRINFILDYTKKKLLELCRTINKTINKNENEKIKFSQNEKRKKELEQINKIASEGLKNIIDKWNNVVKSLAKILHNLFETYEKRKKFIDGIINKEIARNMEENLRIS